MRIGLVSDTHGLFDAELVRLFQGCELILHAGDVTQQRVLDALGRIAPVRGVRGNNDLGPFADLLPETTVVRLGELSAFMIHELGHPEKPVAAARRSLARARSEIVVFGHTHQPLATVQGGILYVNPGAAGPRRFKLPRTAGILEVQGRRAAVALHELAEAGTRPFGQPLDVAL